ncbi:MAG: FISUMP domain-containing protein [Patescibacteria group bacterium]
MKKGFTLLELLIVIGILAVLATTVTIVLNPVELLRQSRDAKRIAELNTLDKALELYSFDGGTNFGSTSTVYISIPDTSSICNNMSSALPALPIDWSYKCVILDNLRKVNSQGWIPVNFTNIANPPLAVLPIDPINITDNYYPSYYSYTVGSWKLAANLESSKYKDKTSNSNNISFSLCPGKVKDADNNEYSTVLINGQCWMKENLKRGIRIAGSSDQTNNGTVEKYCYSDTDSYCTTDGGLYQWDEAMNYGTAEGSQGICPPGWHIPTDAEQYALEDYLKDSGQTCDATRSNTWDCDTAGAKLKSGGASKFEAILAGYRINSLPWFNNRDTSTYF